ncbi:phosphoribosyl-dephospho-CoA transferase [Burkholderia sp. Leaf177]|uniref:malonate decarboxylase holo-ACP synthase n=1 Tax=Burkholderia sp. Leaf177 TaxID=1736287 RepID=UPI0006F5DAB5|nr:malonate decarboxylase holo-ACP synthase [Burkholderia sp. Leaf177]KQR78895.1 phosphoribosyl-dephospho-CoA transferase [Burkholderia sp. Leaf177]
MGSLVNPHDLLRLKADACVFADAPAWVAASLERAPFVVVRRARAIDGRVAIGIRGAVRSERFGSWIGLQHVEAVLTPEMLKSAKPHQNRADLPAFNLLQAITSICDASELAWGPAGSVGFELASERATVTDQSDLDLLMRAPEPLDRPEAKLLFDALSAAAFERAIRIDVQIETHEGAFSLAEFVHPGARVMLRSADGPKLIADPWQTSRAA